MVICVYVMDYWKKKKRETDEDLILVKDGGKYRIAWDVRIEVH
jgi:hypothetical protein